jgi:hypothetical protein
LRRIGESTAALAAADDWVLTHPPTGIRPFTRSSAGNLAIQPKLSISAHRFNSMVQVMLYSWVNKKNCFQQLQLDVFVIDLLFSSIYLKYIGSFRFQQILFCEM